MTDYHSILLQVFYALHSAHCEIDFTHYDLHADDVLIRELGYPIQIAHETENGTEYLMTDKIATIIDYGSSHVVYEGKHCGLAVRGSEYVGINHDKSYPFHDIYNMVFNPENPITLSLYYRDTILRYFSSDPYPRGDFVLHPKRDLSDVDYLWMAKIIRQSDLLIKIQSRPFSGVPIWGSEPRESPDHLVDRILSESPPFVDDLYGPAEPHSGIPTYGMQVDVLNEVKSYGRQFNEALKEFDQAVQTQSVEEMKSAIRWLDLIGDLVGRMVYAGNTLAKVVGDSPELDTAKRIISEFTNYISKDVVQSLNVYLEHFKTDQVITGRLSHLIDIFENFK